MSHYSKGKISESFVVGSADTHTTNNHHRLMMMHSLTKLISQYLCFYHLPFVTLEFYLTSASLLNSA